ncbi:MAG: hypothetical protein LBU19_02550 [Treponema sp.]|jgi:hypothetical protein|nr:hypothetical protein [Treponema sp.]
MMTAEEAAAAAKGLTFEEVWATIQELSAKADERQAKLDKQIAELSKNIGGLNNSFDKWVEEMVSAKLWEKFRALGYPFTQGESNKRYWEDKRTVAEVDLLLENGDYAMPVEIKSILTQEDVDNHLERIGKIRGALDKWGDRRKLVGAVAGMSVSEEVRDYAQKKGLYVLVQSGDSVTVVDVPEGFRVREW